VNEYSFGGNWPPIAVPALHSPKASTEAITNNSLGLRQLTVAKRDPNSSALTPLSPASGTNRSPEKYQRILDAAVAVFAEKGFFVSRISDIADRADVADGTVYLYFKNKDEILATAINTAFDAFMSTARTELEKIPTPSERLRRLAYLHLDALGSNRSLAVVFQMELRQSTRSLSEFSHQHLVEYFSLVRQAICDGKASGEFQKDLPEKIAANCFFGAIDEMVTSWVLSEKDYPLAHVADAVLDILLSGMRATHS
jgi:TetR/AcrR family transcriptional regulator, fatty acid metabolism regulator protein